MAMLSTLKSVRSLDDDKSPPTGVEMMHQYDEWPNEMFRKESAENNPSSAGRFGGPLRKLKPGRDQHHLLFGRSISDVIKKVRWYDIPAILLVPTKRIGVPGYDASWSLFLTFSWSYCRCPFTVAFLLARNNNLHAQQPSRGKEFSDCVSNTPTATLLQDWVFSTNTRVGLPTEPAGTTDFRDDYLYVDLITRIKYVGLTTGPNDVFLLLLICALPWEDVKRRANGLNPTPPPPPPPRPAPGTTPVYL